MTSDYLATVLSLFVLIVLFNQWRRGTLGAWFRAKFLNIGPAPSSGAGGGFTPTPTPAPAGGGGGGGGAW